MQSGFPFGLAPSSLLILISVAVLTGAAAMALFQRRRVREQQAAAALYRGLFENSPAGALVVRGDGTIESCNQRFAEMLGYEPRELGGRNLRELFVRHVEHDELARMLADVRSLNSVELELRHKDSHSVWVHKSVARIPHHGSDLFHWAVVDISDRRRAEEQIEFHAYHDLLTNLPNRRLFSDRLQQSITHSRRSGRAVAVMFIDLDRFKSINDTFGHTAGDQLLLEMAFRLRRCVRDDDTVARLGGDEFVLILVELRHPEDAAAVAQKVLQAVQRPMVIGGTSVEVSASIGIALFPVDGADPESLLRNADSAMYRAKQSGRNNYQLWTEDLKRRAAERLSIKTRLRAAILDGQLSLEYQPQVRLSNGRITAVEALLRWYDPQHGLMQPSSFLEIADESRLTAPMGEWVLRTACRQLKLWEERRISGIRLCVNVALRQFQQPDFVRTVQTVLQDTDLQGNLLELEISETTAMNNADLTADTVRALRALGVGVVIDEFGTGYTSLVQLQRFATAGLKIHRSLIHSAGQDEKAAAVLAAAIGVGKTLGIRTVAVGIETAEQFSMVLKKGADEAQGFYFSRPVPAEEMSQVLIATPTAVRQPRLTV